MEGWLQDLLLVALAGIMGAPHCIIMCGGTMSSFTLKAEAPPLKTIMAYNSGRIITYACMGAVMGMVGSFINVAAGYMHLQGAASIAGGLLILLWVNRKWTLPLAKFSPLQLRGIRKSVSKPRRKTDLRVVFFSGIALGFIPCGLTYAMEMKAAAAGHAGQGALIMAVFGLATLPALAAVGLLSGTIKKQTRRQMLRIGTYLTTAIGILAILRGCSANGWIPSIHPWLW